MTTLANSPLQDSPILSSDSLMSSPISQESASTVDRERADNPFGSDLFEESGDMTRSIGALANQLLSDSSMETIDLPKIAVRLHTLNPSPATGQSKKELSMAKKVEAKIAAEVAMELRERGFTADEINRVKDSLVKERFKAYETAHHFMGDTVREQGREYERPKPCFAVAHKGASAEPSVGKSVIFQNHHYKIRDVKLEGNKYKIRLHIEHRTFNYEGMDEKEHKNKIMTITVPKDNWEAALERDLTSIVLKDFAAKAPKGHSSKGSRARLEAVAESLKLFPKSKETTVALTFINTVLSTSSNIYDPSSQLPDQFSQGGAITDQISFGICIRSFAQLCDAISNLYKAGKRAECGALMEALGLTDLKEELVRFNKQIISKAAEAVINSSLTLMAEAFTTGGSAANLALNTVTAASHAASIAGSALSLAATTVSTIITTKRLIEATKSKEKLELLIKEVTSALKRDSEKNHIADEKANIVIHHVEDMIRALAREQSTGGILEGANVASLVAGAAALAAVIGASGPAAPAVAVGFAVVAVAIMIARLVKDRIERKKENKRVERLTDHNLRGYTDGKLAAFFQLFTHESIPANTKDNAIELEEALENNAYLFTNLMKQLGIENRELYLQVTQLVANIFIDKTLETQDDKKDFFSLFVHTRMASGVKFLAHKITRQLDILKKAGTPPEILEGLRLFYQSKCLEAYKLITTCDLRELKEHAKTNRVLAAALEFGLSEEEHVDNIAFSIASSKTWLTQVKKISDRISALKDKLRENDDTPAACRLLLREAQNIVSQSSKTEEIDFSSPIMQMISDDTLWSQDPSLDTQIVKFFEIALTETPLKYFY